MRRSRAARTGSSRTSVAELPLAGRRIAVTRPREHAGALVERLEGWERSRRSSRSSRSSRSRTTRSSTGLVEHGDHDWIVFTSANAVRAVGPAIRRARARMAAVGPVTAHALRDAGVEPSFTPEVFAAARDRGRARAARRLAGPPPAVRDRRVRCSRTSSAHAGRRSTSSTRIGRSRAAAAEDELADLRAADAIVLMSGSARSQPRGSGRRGSRARRLHRPEDGGRPPARQASRSA